MFQFSTHDLVNYPINYNDSTSLKPWNIDSINGVTSLSQVKALAMNEQSIKPKLNHGMGW
jgi:hypothetical protein